MACRPALLEFSISAEWLTVWSEEHNSCAANESLSHHVLNLYSIRSNLTMFIVSGVEPASGSSSVSKCDKLLTTGVQRLTYVHYKFSGIDSKMKQAHFLGAESWNIYWCAAYSAGYDERHKNMKLKMSKMCNYWEFIQYIHSTHSHNEFLC